MLRKRNTSMRSRGLYVLKRQYHRDYHLRIDPQTWEQYFPGHIPGRYPRVLYGKNLGAEGEQYMDLNVLDLSHRRPLYYDVVERKPFTFTTESIRKSIQFESFLTFLKSGCQLWAIEIYWNQVGVMTGHSAFTADFNWSSSHIAVRVVSIYTFSKVRGRSWWLSFDWDMKM